jgi:putative endopeptidase
MTRLCQQLGFACSALLVVGCSGSTSSSPLPAPAFDPSFLDQSADPCADFYQFSCGSWITQHPTTSDRSFERFENGDDRDQLYFSQLVEAMSSSDSSLQPAQSYYQACLAAHMGFPGTASGIEKQLAVISALKTPADLPVALASLHQLGTSALFHADVGIDPHDPTQYVVTIQDGGWSLPSRAAYDDSQLTDDYRTHMATLTHIAAGTMGTIDIDSKAVLDFEHEIAQAGVDGLDPEAGNEALTTKKLITAVPDFDWSGYFAQRGFGAVAHVNLLQPGFPAALELLLASAPLKTIQNYLTWRVLEADAYSTNSSLINEELQFHRGVVSGETTPPSATYLCLSATRSAFGFELAKHFVESFVPSDLKPAAVSFVAGIRNAMQANLAEVPWLDDDTRAQAQDKLALLLANVAYPDAWPSPPARFASGSNFLDMVLARAQSGSSASAARLAEAVNRDEFWASPEITNAFYSDFRNDITIPVAVLQSPFYEQNRGPAFDYGALGGVVGHELTHAFDNNGRHFDGTGKLVDWWTESVATEFESRTQCLVDQYNGYQALPGVNVDGQLTLPENIADLGGLKLAWSAFEALPERGGSAGSFTAEQQFFLSFAQLQCANLSDEALKQQLASDPHSPPKFRVNGVVRNLPQFAQAFSCAADAPLAPTDRCEIW